MKSWDFVPIRGGGGWMKPLSKFTKVIKRAIKKPKTLREKSVKIWYCFDCSLSSWFHLHGLPDTNLSKSKSKLNLELKLKKKKIRIVQLTTCLKNHFSDKSLIFVPPAVLSQSKLKCWNMSRSESFKAGQFVQNLIWIDLSKTIQEIFCPSSVTSLSFYMLDAIQSRGSYYQQKTLAQRNATLTSLPPLTS